MMCSLLQSTLKTPKLFSKKPTTVEIRSIVLQTFVVAYIWSVGGNIIESNRDIFEHFVKEQFERVEEIK